MAICSSKHLRETAGKVVESIVSELRELKQNTVPEEELRRAKDHLKGSFVLGLESTSSRMGKPGAAGDVFQPVLHAG